MAKALRVFLMTTGLGLAAVAFVAYRFFTYPDTASGSAQGQVEVVVQKGATAGQVARALEAAGLLSRPTLFRLYAGQRGVASRFKAGRYQFEAPTTPRALFQRQSATNFGFASKPPATP
jgi:cell division protein YceG involved in septum cleavage